uniref:F-box domain-containing protein n=2 Tax=Mycena chlorophos TaxID=658473 RepID=A0ABQ0LZI5_MYCCL|nr:predicted protein [Mycena chlorophos]
MSIPRPLLDILPVELWEIILAEMSDVDLLRFSGVSSQLNELCIRLYLARHRLHLDDALGSVLNISGQEHSVLLRALARYRQISVERLNVKFPESGHKDLEGVRLLLGKARELQHLTLTFPDAHLVSRDPEVMRGLRVALAQAALRTEIVIVYYRHAFFTCLPMDVAHWSIHNNRFNPPSLDPIFNTQKKLHTTWHTTTVCHDGTLVTVPQLRNIRTVDLDVVAAEGVSIIMFDAPAVAEFVIADGLASSLQPYMATFLRHGILPQMRNVSITTPSVDAAALRVFLANHPWVATIEFTGRGSGSKAQLLVDPPLEHPGIREIHTRTEMGATSVAGGLLRGLCMSPKLRVAGFHFELPHSENSAPDTDSLLEDFEALARRPPEAGYQPWGFELLIAVNEETPDTTRMSSTLFSSWSIMRSQEAARLGAVLAWTSQIAFVGVAARMKCVRAVRLKLPRALNSQDIAGIARWLASLPGLVELTLQYPRKAGQSVGKKELEARERVLREMKDRLQNINCTSTVA